MLADIVIDAELVDWITAVVAFGGLLLAIVALRQTSYANATAKAANELSKRALQLQEDESKVRLVVKPKMMTFLEEDGRARAVVDVINLSSFPVTIEKICWKTDGPKAYVWLRNLSIANPFNSLPARLPPHECLVAIDMKESLTDDILLTVTAAVACTACGEVIEGMTDEFREYVAKIRADIAAK